MIVTGGTGDAWMPIIRENMKDMETVTIIGGNENEPDLPMVYSNVRGYFLYRASKTRKGGKA
jgi:hypothetical protein